MGLLDVLKKQRADMAGATTPAPTFDFFKASTPTTTASPHDAPTTTTQPEQHGFGGVPTTTAPASPSATTPGLQPSAPTTTAPSYQYQGFDTSQPRTSGPNEPKYAVYDWLKQNNIDPNSDWASGAAQYFNQLFGNNQFWVPEGLPRTLAYQDEYVRGSYGPNDANAAPGSFLWSTQNWVNPQTGQPWDPALYAKETAPGGFLNPSAPSPSMNPMGGGGESYGLQTGGGMTGSGNQSYSHNLTGNQVFTDPATAEWEQLLRQLVTQLTNPRPLGYTDSQNELIQTQTLDPLERDKQAAKERVIQQFAAMGHTMNSGPMQQALLDVDQQFQELRTKAQSAFTTAAIGLEDQRFLGNENRALQGVNLMGQIPALADSRLGMANQSLIPMNPMQLLSLQNQFAQNAQQQNQFQSQQDAAFWLTLAQLLGEVFV